MAQRSDSADSWNAAGSTDSNGDGTDASLEQSGRLATTAASIRSHADGLSAAGSFLLAHGYYAAATSAFAAATAARDAAAATRDAITRHSYSPRKR